jgi:hypothetical protein
MTTLSMIRADQPVAGFYRTRLVKRGPWVPVLIWYGQPIVDGETLDRSWRWCVCLNDETCQDDDGTRVPIDVFRVWPECSGQPIAQAEYEFMVKRVRWAREHAPQSPYANPYEPIELGALPPVTP